MNFVVAVVAVVVVAVAAVIAVDTDCVAAGQRRKTSWPSRLKRYSSRILYS